MLTLEHLTRRRDTDHDKIVKKFNAAMLAMHAELLPIEQHVRRI